MEKTIIPCPMCGALGEVGTQCLFCGMSIPKSESSQKQTFIRFVDKTTVPAEAFAERISKYHSVRSFVDPGVSTVRIGSLYGLINRNGDVVVPLRFSDLEVINGRWLLLCENDEYKLIDMLNWKPLNWKENYGFRDYDVKDGLDGQIIICRGTYRDRNTINYDYQAMANSGTHRNQVYQSSERVFQPKYTIYDLKSEKVINDGEGVVIPSPFEQLAVYQVNYRYQHDDDGHYDPTYGYYPDDGKVSSMIRFISAQGVIIAEIQDLDINEETLIQQDSNGYYLIPKEQKQDPWRTPHFYHRLDHLTPKEKKEGLHRFKFNPNLNEIEQVAEFAQFISNEMRAFKDLNEKRRKEKEEARRQAELAEREKEEREERRTKIIVALIFILGGGGFLLFCALI